MEQSVRATVVEKFGGLVTYGYGGEVFLFTDEAEEGQKLGALAEISSVRRLVKS